MSDGYGYGAAVPSDPAVSDTANTATTNTATTDGNSSVETAKHEAAKVKDTAVTEAGHVAETAKGEAKAVVQEAKTQAKDLFAQTQKELKDQAQTQQQRVAVGLRSVSDELDSLTANAENPGVASDLIQQVSTRISGAASWLGDRDPSSVLSEVKSFARRKPATFIIGAAILGVIAGRLTRALAANAQDERSEPSSPAQLTVSPGYAETAVYSDTPALEETPVYAQSSAAQGTQLPREDYGDVRSDSV